MIKTCKQCNKTMTKPKYRISKNNWSSRVFCSKECRVTFSVTEMNKIEKKKGKDNWKYNIDAHKCIDCGIVREKWCRSSRCKKCSNLYLRGENHPNYKDGSSLISRYRKYSYEYKKWRESIFKRDWFTCQMPFCFYKGKDIEAHHIERVIDNKDGIFNTNNGITLCKKCHLHIRNKEKFFSKLFRIINGSLSNLSLT